MHFHVQIGKRGETPYLAATTYRLFNAQKALRRLLTKELACSIEHNHNEVKCYTFDTPFLSAKVADNHHIRGYKVDNIYVLECIEVQCYRTVCV